MSRLRLISGVVVGTILPPLAASAAAGLSAYLADLKLWTDVAVMAGAAGVVPQVMPRIGALLSGPSTRDKALGIVLTMLVEELLKQGTSADSTPAVRATAFVPARLGKEHVLMPHLRVTSRSDKVERLNRDFRSEAYFRKGESFVGQVWEASTKSVYKDCKAEVDFADGQIGDAERVARWAKQFDSKITDRWSDHMRKVRTIWVFAIPKIERRDGGDGRDTDTSKAAPNVVAVISVDAIQRDAFSAPAVDGGSLFTMDARQATATAVVGMFHSLANRRKRLRGIFKR